MLKSTSLVSTISLMEMTGQADAIVSSTFRALEVFLTAAVTYCTSGKTVVTTEFWSMNMTIPTIMLSNIRNSYGSNEVLRN